MTGAGGIALSREAPRRRHSAEALNAAAAMGEHLKPCPACRRHPVLWQDETGAYVCENAAEQAGYHVAKNEE